MTPARDGELDILDHGWRAGWAAPGAKGFGVAIDLEDRERGGPARRAPGSPHDTDGSRHGWCGANADIHDRKVVEEALSLARAIAQDVTEPVSGILINASAALKMLTRDPPDIEGALRTVRRTLRDADRAARAIGAMRGSR